MRHTTLDRAMAMALVLARRGMGATRPNPPVGAVVTQEGAVVGTAFHGEAGAPHAEALALDAAGERARGATLCVTLEPCNHAGRTPPCVPRIVERGIRRVEIAVRDPNPLSNHGLDALRSAGVEVAIGRDARRARYLLAGFASRVERKRPRFALKMASSLDGKIASSSGDSRWISSDIARAWVHRRRREADAILVGRGTVRADDPLLSTRSVRGRNPDRIVLDTGLEIPASAKVWKADGPRRIAVASESAPAAAKAVLERSGVEIWSFPESAPRRLDLLKVAERLGDEGYTHVLVEGGGRVAGAFLEAQLVDTIWLVISRHVLLGGGGPGWSEGLRVPSVTRALKVSRSNIERLGPDWLCTIVPEYAQWWDPETGHV
jgi:diaminohydroxyphosphoribosylaminopyrimidine deaminase / 5-amino-6-(5-phosphoribosylamino)uracil reductase